MLCILGFCYRGGPEPLDGSQGTHGGHGATSMEAELERMETREQELDDLIERARKSHSIIGSNTQDRPS